MIDGAKDKIIRYTVCTGWALAAIIALDAAIGRGRTMDAKHRQTEARNRADSLQYVIRVYDKMVDDGVDIARAYRDRADADLQRADAEYRAATAEIYQRGSVWNKIVTRAPEKIK